MLYKKIYVINPKANEKFEYEFKEGYNILHGSNRSGKSTVVKSMMYALGFAPKWSKTWKKDDYIYNLILETDNKKKINVVRYGNYFKINESEMMNYKEFRKKFYELSEYDVIKLKAKNSNESTIPNVDMLFKFFYIDQELAWDGPLFYRNKYLKYSKEIDKIQFKHIIGCYNEEVHLLTTNLTNVKAELKFNNEKVEKIQDVIDSLGGENYTPLEKDAYKKQLENMVNEIDEYRKIEVRLNKKIIELKYKNSEIKKNVDLLKQIKKQDNRNFCSSCNQEILNMDVLISHGISMDNINSTILQLKNTYSQNQENIANLDIELEQIFRKLDSLKELNTKQDKTRKELELNTVIQRLIDEKSVIMMLISELNSQKSSLSKLKNEILNKFNLKETRLIEELNKQLINLESFFNQECDSISSLDPFLDIDNIGTAYNLEKIAVYYSFLTILDTNSKYNIPIIWDTLIKEEVDEEIQQVIDEFYATHLNKFIRQTLVTYPRKLANLSMETDYNIIEIVEMKELEEKDFEFIKILID